MADKSSEDTEKENKKSKKKGKLLGDPICELESE